MSIARLTLDILDKVMPDAARVGRTPRWLDPLSTAMTICEADANALRASAFLAQIAHESGQLRYTREIWGPTAQQLRYEPPSELASKLGNIYPGDGSLYRGRGILQVTGRHNYAEFTNWARQHYVGAPDFVNDPAPLEEARWAALSAAWYWSTRSINIPADAGDFYRVTRLINGGTNGMAERLTFYDAAKKAYGV